MLPTDGGNVVKNTEKLLLSIPVNKVFDFWTMLMIYELKNKK